VLPYIGNSCKKSSCTSFDVNNIILVRGATGNIGIEVVKQLSAAQMGFKAAVQSESNAKKILEISTKVELAEIDYDKPEIVEKAFKNVDKLFLLTPTTPKSDLCIEAHKRVKRNDENPFSKSEKK
jgi:uncharacterized protein YbjT (DUF2867 family)